MPYKHRFGNNFMEAKVVDMEFKENKVNCSIFLSLQVFCTMSHSILNKVVFSAMKYNRNKCFIVGS